jgi:Fe-S cluster assembly protein SufD
MHTEVNAPITRESVEALSRSKQEPAWLTALRAGAASAAETLEWPKPEKMRIDRWNLQALGNYTAANLAATTEGLPEDIRAILPGSGDNLLVQRNSGAAYRHLAKELQDKGVIFTDLETACREHGDLVQQHLFTAIDKDADKLNAIHAALWNGGVFIYVPKNVEVDIPLQAVLFHDQADASLAPHILLVADQFSSVTYVDHVVTSGDGSATPVVHHAGVEVIVKAGAKVRFATVHHMANNVVELTIRRAVIDNDGSMEWIIGDLHDGNVLSDTKSILKGNGSTSDAKVIAVGTHAQNMSLTTQAVHFGRSSDSNMVTRAVMRDQASAIINGITKIEHGATKANGVQTERVLMLSPKARGDANPILLIDEDDVTAGHAASVGQVNAEQIYYLMSRGISRTEAEKLIINGFLAPVVSEIPIEAVREQLASLLERKLGS